MIDIAASAPGKQLSEQWLEDPRKRKPMSRVPSDALLLSSRDWSCLLETYSRQDGSACLGKAANKDDVDLLAPCTVRRKTFGSWSDKAIMLRSSHSPAFPEGFHLLSFVALLLFHVDKAYAESPTEEEPNNTAVCTGTYFCKPGVILPIWEPQDPSFSDKIARATVYFVAMVYMFLGVSIIADRFMSSIEVITSQEREITIKKPNGETSKTTVRVWNETVSNLTLMALGSSAPEILLSVIEVCGHGFNAGDLGPSTIVGSAAFNMFIIIAICVYVVPDGEIRKIKHLRVFFVTAAWSIFAYTWLYLILSVISPGVVEVWESLLTFFFFPICVVFAWVADRRLLFYKYVYKKYRAGKQRGMIIEHEGDRPSSKADIEMDGKVVNSHVENFLDGTLVLEADEKDQDDEEARREMARILKELKQKHPDKEIEQLIELANYQVLSQQQKSRAFYRIQATRLMTGAGNILKRHAADQARKAVSMHEVNCEVVENDPVSKIYFEQNTYQCLENCGTVALTIARRGGDLTHVVHVDFRTEDGTANAGSDYEFTEGTVVFKPGETQKEIRVGIIDDDIFEEDENFLVHLSNVQVSTEALDEGILKANHVATLACLGSPSTATVTIFDDDHAGIFTFEEPVTHVSESIGTMEVKVLRTSGARGNVVVPYKTVEGSARGGGEDFEDTCGELEFQNDEIV
ncbi:GAS2-like protein 1 [Platysternon megacephalum]|uniref:Sodium/calcium exchanger 1 n=1 Tax=Platysternon megacephalum TaxID=55544 RepID=A0A4D9DY68_9SAUR|nr:GAS2-like protein 1 [Platysternon megacephalum]